MGAGGRHPAYEPTPGVIAVGAGKGGVGTSVVAALLAIEAARRGEQVLLVDADESIGSLHFMLGVDDPGPGFGALRGGAVEPDALLVPAAHGVTLLPGGGGGIDATLSNAAGEYRAMLRRVWTLFPSYSTVIVDAGSRLHSVTTTCATGVERLMCLTAPDRISLAASYALFKVLRGRFAELPIELLVNGTDEHQGRTLHAVVRTATQSFLGTDVRLGGTIPTDRVVAGYVESGRSLSIVPPNGAAPAAVGGVVHRVLTERYVGAEGALYPALPG